MKLKMKWLTGKHKKNPLSGDGTAHNRHDPQHYTSTSLSRTSTSTTSPAVEWVARLPAPLVERIFSFVCPHASDETYETCEQSAVEDTCMLCDLRDLSHCAQVSRRWRTLAANVLYHSVRIDAVHYCEREDLLAEKRKHRSFINRNADPEDTPQMRLRLLCRTLREDRTGISLKLRILKLPYMTRETSKPDLARLVAVTPNLRYIDLPEGVFTDEPSSHALRVEIQGRCPDLRKMTYAGGAERGLELLPGGLWRNLESLELTHLNTDPTVLRQALGSLPHLRVLKVSDMKAFDDQLFHHNDYLPPWPALQKLIFSHVPNLTGEGLLGYLSRPDNRYALKSLSLEATGVQVSTLQQVLAAAPKLTLLSVIEGVTSALPIGIPSLSSSSLTTLHYEITSAVHTGSYFNTTASYYAYLTSSLISNSLPALTKLYVRDANFPESLIDLAPPAPAFASDPDALQPPPSLYARSTSPSSISPHSTGSNRLSSNNPFLPAMNLGLRNPLQVFSKGLDEMEWSFSRVQPAARGRRASATALRPVSSAGLDAAHASWGGPGTRRSVIVGNGFGGFLAVPVDDAGNEQDKKRGSQYDMWR